MLAPAIPELGFTVVDGGPRDAAAVPTVRFGLRIEGGPVRALALQVQVRIAAPLRPYDAETRERLRGVFGVEEQWSTSLRSLLWTTVGLVVPAFEDDIAIDLDLPCTYDFQVGSAQYLDALRDGIIPLEFLFSGTIFHTAEDGRLQVALVPWDREATYRLPVTAYREAMDRHFPGAAWLRLDRERFDRLHAYRTSRALPTWEATIDALLKEET